MGIDYALLLVTRFTEGLMSGLSVRAAAGHANGTAGLSVVFAGTTVLVSLFGLCLAGLPVYSSFGYATFAMVGSVMLASVTLVPALCGLAGVRILGRRRKFAAPRRDSLTARWAARIGRRPLPWAVGALLVLLLLAAPVLQMRTWPQDAGSQPTSNTTRLAYDLIAAEFGPGANGPFVVAVDLKRVPKSELAAMASSFAADPGIAAVSPPTVNADGSAAIISVQPDHGAAGRGDESDTRAVARDSFHRTATSPASPRCSRTSPTGSPSGSGW